MMSSVKYIISSFSGLLCKLDREENDPKEADIQLIQNAFSQCELTVPHHDIIEDKMRTGEKPETIFHQISPEDSSALHEAYEQQLEKNYINNMQLADPKIPNLLATLQEAEVKIIIVDFRTPTSVKEALEHLKIAQYIDSVIETKPDGELRKANPAVFNKLIKEKYPEITADNTIIIGHQSADINFAHHPAVNLPFCWAKYAGADYEMCRPLLDKETDKVFYNATDLFTHLHSLV